MLTNSIVRTPKMKALLLALVASLWILSGCGNMREQPKLHEPYSDSPNFEQGAARNLDPNAVPVGYMRIDEHLYQGTVDGEYVESYPFEITRGVLEEGRRQYEAYCAMCHGFAGYGNGVVAQEGYPQPAPASYHIERLRNAPEGYYFDVITNGQGLMYSYGSRIQVEDRWAIVAYIRALQFSQNANQDELPFDAASAADDDAASDDTSEDEG